MPQYLSTIGTDFLTKEVNIEETVIKLQIWDIAGAGAVEDYNSIYRNSECCVLVFDLTEPKSFESIESWRNKFLNKLNPEDPETFPFVLLGNKCDKQEERKVEAEKIKQYCQSKSNMTLYLSRRAEALPSSITEAARSIPSRTSLAFPAQ